MISGKKQRGQPSTWDTIKHPVERIIKMKKVKKSIIVLPPIILIFLFISWHNLKAENAALKSQNNEVTGVLEIIPIQPPEHDFFSKQVLCCDGIPIRAHKDVEDAALIEASRRISRMLEMLPVVTENLVDLDAALEIIGKNQQPSDLPALRHWKGKPYDKIGDRTLTIDERTRGVGGIPASCGEENLLKLSSDRYWDHRDICTHEFAHTVFTYGFSDNIRKMVDKQFKKSLEQGLWKTAYASTNVGEFFAELSMWYFDSRGDYGRIMPTPKEGREWLKKYDPDAFDLMDQIYSGLEKVERIAWEPLPKISPEKEMTVRSINYVPPVLTSIFFDNRTSNDLSLFWLDGTGNRKLYVTVRAGQKYVQQTYAGHPWVVVQTNGKAVGIYVAEEVNGKVILE